MPVKIPVIAFILFATALLASGVFYIVDEREKALRLWFGEVTAEITEPGLNFYATWKMVF